MPILDRPRRGGRVLFTVAVVVGLLAIPTSVGAASIDAVVLRFDQARAGEALTAPANSGDAAATTDVAVVTRNGGSIIAVDSYPGQGLAGDFPSFDGASTGPRAVIRVTNKPGAAADAMNPGTGRLEYGADITIDGTSVWPGSTDDGNNVIQRGLFADVAQFKLEVDRARPGCRVKGAGGATSVTSTVAMQAGSRYRVRCVRSGGQSTVRVTPISPSGELGTTVSTSARDVSGNMRFAIGTPLSVGGKLGSSGTLVTSASDQYNGTIDNAILRLGS